MAIGVLNNISALYAENNLNATYSSLQKTLQQLSSGSKINSGADDPAGISIIDRMQATESSLTVQHTCDAELVGMYQVAGGALSQVNSLLDRAITLATEASNGTLNSAQESSINQEYESILAEITNIGTTTTYNQSSLFIMDPNGSGSVSIGQVPGTSDHLGDTTLTDAGSARTALARLNSTISDVAAAEDYYGTSINGTTAYDSVVQTQATNTAAALDAIQGVDYAKATSDLSKEEVLMQMGISALAQSNKAQQDTTELVQSL